MSRGRKSDSWIFFPFLSKFFPPSCFERDRERDFRPSFRRNLLLGVELRPRNEIESEERRMEDIIGDKRRHLEHLDHRLAERTKELADAEAEVQSAREETAKRKASTMELRRLEEEVENWKKKFNIKEKFNESF